MQIADNIIENLFTIYFSYCICVINLKNIHEDLQSEILLLTGLISRNLCK